MSLDLELLADVVYEVSRDSSRTGAAHLRAGTVLSIDSATSTASVRLDGSANPTPVLDENGDAVTDVPADLLNDTGVDVALLDGAVVAVGDAVHIVQEHDSYLLLGRTGQHHTVTTWETRTPTPWGGWTWYTGYGPGVAQRVGFMVTITGLVQRTAASFTPAGSSFYEYLVVPWPADKAHTGIVWSSLGPLRWYLAAGTTTLTFSTMPGTATGAMATSTGVISCQISYSVSPATAAGRLDKDGLKV